ncbi:hypothetical protein NL676_023691 [Syzygium grande]|nr:hypothetical protein NL676_023691 [Syzygium grande]
MKATYLVVLSIHKLGIIHESRSRCWLSSSKLPLGGALRQTPLTESEKVAAPAGGIPTLGPKRLITIVFTMRRASLRQDNKSE